MREAQRIFSTHSRCEAAEEKKAHKRSAEKEKTIKNLLSFASFHFKNFFFSS
jgi:hypothetical protein